MSNLLSTLLDKGIDLGVSFIPGGAFAKDVIKSLANSLLGKEEATEEEIAQAVKEATPQQIQSLNAQLELIKAQHGIEIEKTNQAIELTKQTQLAGKEKALDFIRHIMGKHPAKAVCIYSIIFYIMLGVGLWYCNYENNDELQSIEFAILALGITYISLPAALIFEPMYKIIDALSSSIAHAINVIKRI